MHRLRKTSVVLLGTTLLSALWPAAGWAGPPPVVFSESISRPVTVSVRDPDTPVFDDAVSRPITVLIRNPNTVEFAEAVSRPVTVVIRDPNIAVFSEAISRSVTVTIRDPSTAAFAEAISRPLTVRVGDCNGNFVLDADDVIGGSSPDDNANGLPDECDICGDLDADLDVDGDDFGAFLIAFSFSTGDPEYDPEADYDLDGIVTLLDYQAWRQCYRDFIGDPFASAPIPGDVGDLNADGSVDGLDIQLFVDVVMSPGTAQFREYIVADIDGDGQVSTNDVSPFVGLLLAGDVND